MTHKSEHDGSRVVRHIRYCTVINVSIYGSKGCVLVILNIYRLKRSVCSCYIEYDHPF